MSRVEHLKQFLDIDWLVKNHELIHYFGLGFIQLKLNQSEIVYPKNYQPTCPFSVKREKEELFGVIEQLIK